MMKQWVATPFGDKIVPMVGADAARVESLKPMAQAMATQLKKNIKIVVFSNREEIGVIKPRTWVGPI